MVEIFSLRESGSNQEKYLFQLALWHHNEWLHLNPGASLEDRVKRYKKSILSTGLPEIFIACSEDQLLGSVTLDKSDMDTRPHLTPWLASLFVEPASRSRGIASQLITHCIAYAKKTNFKNIYLFTEDQIKFYKHRGWHFVETVEYRDSEVDLMRQHIT